MGMGLVSHLFTSLVGDGDGFSISPIHWISVV